MSGPDRSTRHRPARSILVAALAVLACVALGAPGVGASTVQAPTTAPAVVGGDATAPDDDPADDGWSPTARTWGFIIAGLAVALFLLDRVGRVLGNRKLRRDHERDQRRSNDDRPPG